MLVGLLIPGNLFPGREINFPGLVQHTHIVNGGGGQWSGHGIA